MAGHCRPGCFRVYEVITLSAYDTIDVPLLANTPNRFPVTGKYVRVLKSTGDLLITIDGKGPYFIQQGIGVPVSDGFNEITLQSSTAQTVTLGISDSVIHDNRFTLDGAVSIIDEAFNKSVNGTAFELSSLSNGIAGKWSGVSLYNPAGSGVNCYVKKMIGASIAGGGYQIYGISDDTVAGFGGTFQGENKNLSLVANNSQSRGKTYSDATNPVLIATALYRQIQIAAGTSQVMDMIYPFVLPPGFGIMLVAQNIAADTGAVFEFDEVPL